MLLFLPKGLDPEKSFKKRQAASRRAPLPERGRLDRDGEGACGMRGLSLRRGEAHSAGHLSQRFLQEDSSGWESSFLSLLAMRHHLM